MANSTIRRHTTIAAVVAALLGMFPAPASADPGDLDPTFGNDGIVDTAVGNEGSSPLAVTVQPDGRIVAVGGTFGGRSFALARFRPDGRLDPTFGADGRVLTRLGESALAVDVAVVSRGLLVAGSVVSDDVARIVVARYGPDGRLDTTFASDGVATIRFKQDAFAAALALQQDGKIVVAGAALADRSRFALARLTPDGLLDPTFSENGKVTTAVHGQPSAASAVVVSPRGILAVGSVAPHRARRLAVARYSFHGQLDERFSGDGLFKRSLSAERGVETFGTSVAVDTQGRAIIGARVVHLDLIGGDAALLRMRATGSLDDSFARDGSLVTSDIHAASAVEIQGDGKFIVAGGICCGGGDEWTNAVARFLPRGRLDPLFGDAGVALPAPHPPHAGPLTDAQLQADGRIVAVGRSGWSEGFLAVRLLAR